MIPDSWIGPLALLGRILGLGFERPLVKALGKGRDSVVATTLYFGLGLISLAPVIIIGLLRDPGYLGDIAGWIPTAAMVGVLYAICFFSYVYALSVGEVSYLTPLYATAFVWLYALDIIFGEATLGVLPVIGVLAVTVGIVFLNVAPGRPLREVLHPLTVLRQPGAIGMLIYAFGLATARIFDNSVSDIAPQIPYAFIANTPCVLGGLVWLGFKGKLGNIAKLQVERPWIAIVGAISGMYAYVLMLLALRYYSPSVVEPVTQLSLFIAVGLGILWFKEPPRARWLAAALVVVGAVLLLV